jgi:hypothetical protein
MKKNTLTLLLFLSAVICLAPSCKKKNEDPLSQLPAATQTGANTFGCLINGVAFTPHSNSFLNSDRQCNYIYLNGGYYFTVGASNDSNNDYGLSLIIGTTILSVNEGQTLKLENYNQAGKAFGTYTISYNTKADNGYETNTNSSGQLHITKFDQTNQIISGTFFYDATNAQGDIVHVTDGRFDMQYTR